MKTSSGLFFPHLILIGVSLSCWGVRTESSSEAAATEAASGLGLSAARAADRVFRLEQVRTPSPEVTFRQAREKESPEAPLPGK